jgi:hypothetical protein
MPSWPGGVKILTASTAARSPLLREDPDADESRRRPDFEPASMPTSRDGRQ